MPNRSNIGEETFILAHSLSHQGTEGMVSGALTMFEESWLVQKEKELQLKPAVEFQLQGYLPEV